MQLVTLLVRRTSGDMPFGGVLICGKTAIMPMSLGFKGKLMELAKDSFHKFHLIYDTCGRPAQKACWLVVLV